MKLRNNNPRKFFTQHEIDAFQQEIKTAEKKTTCEIKFIAVQYCWDDIKRQAVYTFRKFKLYQTKDRNAVLIMLVTTNKEFIIYGDIEIHSKVGQDFWESVVDEMSKRFKENKFGEGISRGIFLIGEKCAQHFPYNKDDKNEISNKVGYDN